MMKYPLKKIMPLVAAFCLCVIPACSSNNNSPIVLVPDPPAPIEEVIPEETIPAFVSPLTGYPLDEPSSVRPITVMINNAPAARPQSGLTEADLLYEVLLEGGITRYVAVFQNGDEEATIGPIRSIRPYLIELGESLHGVLVHSGGSPEAYSIMKKESKEHLDEITNAGAYFWRDKARKAPHNLYSKLEQMRKGALKKKFELSDTAIPAFTFRAPDELIEGEKATDIDITFLLKSYKVSYHYNADTLLYERSINDKPHIDLNNEQILTATNIVILGADHKVLDDIGRLGVDVNSGGEAMLFERGKVIEGQWVRHADDVIRFVKGGVEVPFYAGKTHFIIVPNTPTFASHIHLNGEE